MTAKDIMTKEIIKISIKASIGEAIQMCAKNNVSGLVVVNEEGQISGILSEKDLLVAYDFLAATDSCIEDFVTKEVVSVKEDAAIEEIIRFLVQHNFKRAPVMAKGEVIGIVSRGDILRWLASSHADEGQ